MFKMKLQAALLRCVMQWPVGEDSLCITEVLAQPPPTSFSVHFHPEFIFSAQQSEKQEAF